MHRKRKRTYTLEGMIDYYEESEQAWKSDNKLTPFIVALFLIGGTYIWRKTKKEYKYTQY